MDSIRERFVARGWHGPSWLFVLLLLALSAAWFSPPSAQAEQVVGGKLMIKLTNMLDAQLKLNGIEVRAWHRTRKTRRVTLEVPGGSLDVGQSGSPTNPLGGLRLRGAIGLRSGSREVRIRKLVLDMTKDRLLGSVGNRELVVADTEGRRFYPRGLEVVVATDLRLAQAAARIFNARLRPVDPLISGQRMAFVNGIVFLAPASSEPSR